MNIAAIDNDRDIHSLVMSAFGLHISAFQHSLIHLRHSFRCI